MMVRPHKLNETIVNGWLFFCYLLIHAYVGLISIVGFARWFLYYEGDPKLPYKGLFNFDTCLQRETTYS